MSCNLKAGFPDDFFSIGINFTKLICPQREKVCKLFPVYILFSFCFFRLIPPHDKSRSGQIRKAVRTRGKLIFCQQTIVVFISWGCKNSFVNFATNKVATDCKKNAKGNISLRQILNKCQNDTRRKERYVLTPCLPLFERVCFLWILLEVPETTS